MGVYKLSISIEPRIFPFWIDSPMKNLILLLLLLLLSSGFDHPAAAASLPAGQLVRQLSSLLRWTSPSSRMAPRPDESVMHYEGGYVVETVVQGNEIGVLPCKIRVAEDGELYAVDEVNSNIVKITPPLSQYSRARLVAGSFQGLSGHVDGKPSDARFNHPKGVAMDDKGNVYVADTLNLAVRKIGDSGVTTIAGGKSNLAGYRDGPSEDAKFSNDFDVVYVRPTCSLLVIDRGNAALRRISLDLEDCDYQHDSVSSIDMLMVAGAVVVGYALCILQQGYASSFFSRRMQHVGQASVAVFEDKLREETASPVVDNPKEVPGWPSFGQLMVDLSKLALEAFAALFLYLVPTRIRVVGSRKGLTPLKDSLRLPEDEVDRKLAQPQRTTPAVPSETRRMHTQLENHSEAKPPKIKSTSFKDPSMASKQKSSSSRRQEFDEFYGTTEAPTYIKSKSNKERVRHRQREGCYGSVGMEQKLETKPGDSNKPQKYEHYNLKNKYSPDESFRF
ncbi:hypothetical protein MLD38_012652 [Melastoma candidum]|uniref:Uncharacterized protein n=1 Tax=Melastoma candidum TaxID=119954 RepID=A0ACB9R6G0_9MYRT|nr:hypothetical protein MLD38_012652 [Melastoma candidum]